MSNQEVQAQNNQGGSGTNTAGGTTTATGANQPATTGSTGAAGTAAGSSGSNDNMPARGMVRMTKADLQNAPEFRYDNNRSNALGGGAATNPPASTTRPGNAPAQQGHCRRGASAPLHPPFGHRPPRGGFFLETATSPGWAVRGPPNGT